MFYLENSLTDKNYIFCTWIGELNTWYVLFSNNSNSIAKTKLQRSLHNSLNSKGIAHQKIPQTPKGIKGGSMFPIICEPVGRKSGFVGTFDEFFAGLQLAFPIAHGVGLRSQAFNIPKMKKRLKLRYWWKISTFYWN